MHLHDGRADSIPWRQGYLCCRPFEECRELCLEDIATDDLLGAKLLLDEAHPRSLEIFFGEGLILLRWSGLGVRSCRFGLYRRHPSACSEESLGRSPCRRGGRDALGLRSYSPRRWARLGLGGSGSRRTSRRLRPHRRDGRLCYCGLRSYCRSWSWRRSIPLRSCLGRRAGLRRALRRRCWG